MTESNIYLKRDLASVGFITFTGMCFGIIYPIFGDKFSDSIAFINGISIGMISGLLLAIFEIFIFKRGTDKRSFISLFIIKAILYFTMSMLLVVLIICFTGSLENKMGFNAYFFSAEFQEFIFSEFKIIMVYCMMALVIINFTRKVNRSLGPGVLWSYITGKYHHPNEDYLIFAFIDLNQSTQIAEKLGDLKFHILLREFFNDISKCIFITNGRIYRYVGDEIVISWNIREGLNNANCIRAWFYINEELEKHKQKYLDTFGFVPEFHAAFHSGNVIRGEIGDVKSQLVFHGETMYISSQIEEQCSVLGYNILISNELKDKINIPARYGMKVVGQLNEMKLYTLYEKN